MNDSQSVERKDVMGETLLAKLDEIKKKSKGDSIDVKNQEEENRNQSRKCRGYKNKDKQLHIKYVRYEQKKIPKIKKLPPQKSLI